MTDTRGKAALGGIDGNLAALLGYIIWIVALISVIMEKENRFVKFHAIQSLLLNAAAVIVFIALMILLTILGIMLAFAGLGALGAILWLLYMVVVVGYIAALIYAAVKAYGGVEFKLPIIGNMAEKWTN
ncbi:MAG TPA: DUF4870 domain-containing protein [Pyrinomonadaceae bacterium]|nr:DUF4870 domain-containing protein [Pyrinomonadaceae bacterium]